MNSKSKLLAPELVNAERPVWAFSKKIFCEGMRDGVPIALGYFAVSFSLGIAARRALAPETRAAANATLCARLAALPCFRQARTILLYAAFGGEADLATLAETARGLGKTLAYPVCGENFSLTAAVPGEDGWEAGAYGIRTPILSRAEILPPEALDLILVPCTAFDAACGRVGMGKGYYDRYLPRCTRAVKLGIAFEAQRVPHAALDEHDQRLDAFITEGGIYRGTDKIEL